MQRRERIGESAGRDAARRCLRFVHLAMHAQSSSCTRQPRASREDELSSCPLQQCSTQRRAKSPYRRGGVLADEPASNHYFYTTAWSPDAL